MCILLHHCHLIASFKFLKTVHAKKNDKAQLEVLAWLSHCHLVVWSDNKASYLCTFWVLSLFLHFWRKSTVVTSTALFYIKYTSLFFFHIVVLLLAKDEYFLSRCSSRSLLPWSFFLRLGDAMVQYSIFFSLLLRAICRNWTPVILLPPQPLILHLRTPLLQPSVATRSRFCLEWLQKLHRHVKIRGLGLQEGVWPLGLEPPGTWCGLISVNVVII